MSISAAAALAISLWRSAILRGAGAATGYPKVNVIHRIMRGTPAQAGVDIYTPTENDELVEAVHAAVRNMRRESQELYDVFVAYHLGVVGGSYVRNQYGKGAPHRVRAQKMGYSRSTYYRLVANADAHVAARLEDGAEGT